MTTVRVEMETLYCEPGDHKWRRPKTRGRKPISCGDHKPVAVVQANPAGQKVETLHCVTGNHNWERVSVRGRKPTDCPEHKPTQAVTTPRITAPRPANQPVGSTTLYCENGKHDWEREPTRGRKPVHCPEHSGPRAVPVRVISDSFPIADISDDDLPIVEVEGEYESETTEDEQRELLTAAFNPVNPAPKKRGRPKLYQNEDEQKEAELARSRAKVDQLEANLKAHGTHISQQAPYSLYKLVKGIANTPGAEYQFVRLFSPLAKAQFVNQFPDRFNAGIYYFEKDKERIDDKS